MTGQLFAAQTAGPARDALSMWADVAMVAFGALAAIGVVAIVVLLLQIRKIGNQVTSLAKQVEGKVDPVLERSRTIAQNVEYISASVKKEVEQVTGSVRQLSERLEQASEYMETRIDEFNALMEVVQDEAESQFLDAASAVRGVRASARSLAGGGRDSEKAEDDEESSDAGGPRVLKGPSPTPVAPPSERAAEVSVREREAR
jgi:methyl-accepting chemotaxis protein